jgi:hypothetical protein
MNTYKTNPRSLSTSLHFRFRRGLLFGIIIITALIAFEIFNFSTTQYALKDLLGNLSFMSIPWATILTIAFCGIDFAGIARLFTPEEGANEPNEVWYLFGGWLLAATMNAMLTWWGVSQAIINNPALGTAVLSRATVIRVVPIFVAVLVWLIRIMIIGTFSVSGDRLFSQRESKYTARFQPASPTDYITSGSNRVLNQPAVSTSTFKPSPKPNTTSVPSYTRSSPTYSQPPMSASAPSTGGVSGSQSSRLFQSKSNTTTRQ